MPDHYLGARHPTFVGRKPPVTKTKQDRERGGRGPMRLRKDRRTKAVLLDILSLPSLQEIRENPGDAGRQVTETALLGHAAKALKIGKPVVTAAKAAMSKALASQTGMLAPAMGIISKEGQKLYKTANRMFESGTGQPAIRDSIKKLRLKEQKGLNKPSVTGLRKEELDEAAALSITNPTHGRLSITGKPAKRELVKASQGVTLGRKQSTKGLTKTNKELMETKEGTSTASALIRTAEKADKGLFNTQNKRAVAKATRKEVTRKELEEILKRGSKRKK